MPPENPTADQMYCFAEVDLFRDLSRREMAVLGAKAPIRTVERGTVVYSPANPVPVLFIVNAAASGSTGSPPTGAPSPQPSSNPAPSMRSPTRSPRSSAPGTPTSAKP
ncbi:MAG: hypothetical protein ACRDSE_22410 [Pseudonocardiaceae bacterium]